MNKPDHFSLWNIITALTVINVIFGVFLTFRQIKLSQDYNQASASYSQEVVLGAQTVPIFSPSFVMSDDTFSSTRAFPNEEAVQAYLQSSGSFLKDYTVNGRRASYWIFAAARGVSSSKYGVTPQLNPGVIIAYLQKEQSLISTRTYDVERDPERKLSAAMGYGCPDTAACDSTYFGFVNQVNWGAYQLQYNFNIATTNKTQYRVGATVATLDEYSVFMSNAATAAQYRYTPHVYWGNYNLWKIITANGWGVSSQTWSQQELDRVNLANKDIQVHFDNGPAVTFEQVQSFVTKNYTLGTVNDEVKLIQQYLRQEGFYMTRTITGMFGIVTQDALSRFRQERGIVIQSTQGNSDTCRTLIAANYSIGDNNDNVRRLQECLRVLGLFNWPANTGFFGPVTQTALSGARRAQSNPAPAAPATESCTTLLASNWTAGQRSERVKQLQGCLRVEGVFSWPVDTGFFGPVTQTALNAFRTKSAPAAPAPTPAPAPAQAPTPAPTPTAPASTTNCTTLRSQNWTIGTTSPAVRRLQECMRTAGTFNWPYITGYFGPVTQESLNRWRGTTTNQTFTCQELRNQVWVEGQRSERVRQLQVCMQNAGTFKWRFGATGYFGSVTRDALIAWRGYM